MRTNVRPSPSLREIKVKWLKYLQTFGNSFAPEQPVQIHEEFVGRKDTKD